jgi:hypothetical protein
MTEKLLDLIKRSDELEAELVGFEETGLSQLEDIDFHQETFEKKKADFYANEHMFEAVPGDPKLKWNDKRRAAYISKEYAAEESKLQEAEKAYRKTTSAIKIVSIKISGLNRKIRLLELIDGRVSHAQ